jgi:hypothetical protein
MLAQAAAAPRQMKNSLLLKVAVLAAILSGALCCFPQDGSVNSHETAQRFVESLYVRYGQGGNPVNLSAPNAGDAFDPSLIALVKAGAAAVGQGHAGVLDYDPLCNCQETDVDFPSLKITTQPLSASRANATVTFNDVKQDEIKIVLTLVMNRNGWRIFNVEDFTGPGPHTDLRTLLSDEIQKHSDKQNPKKRSNQDPSD